MATDAPARPTIPVGRGGFGQPQAENGQEPTLAEGRASDILVGERDVT